MPTRLPLVALCLSCLAGPSGAGAAEVPKLFRPVGRVLEVRGLVLVRQGDDGPRAAQLFDTLYAGDLITTNESSSLTAAFRADGHLERVKSSAEVKVAAAGCAPDSAVEKLPPPAKQQLVASETARGLRAFTRGGGIVVRSVVRFADGPDQAACPAPGATVATTRPVFTWPSHPMARGYHLMVGGTEGVAATLVSKEPSASLPEDKPLRAGGHYYLVVMAVVGRGDGEDYELAQSHSFSVADDTLARRAAEVVELAQADAAPLAALAALWLEEHGFIEEAIAANERAAKIALEPAPYYLALGDLYDLTQRRRAAEAARAKAAGDPISPD